MEAQHAVATRALVDSLAEQELLERLLEDSKPPVPAEGVRLDYLIYTPFRYPPVHHGSRFRAYDEPGAWYGAEQACTSCAELGYWRWRFVADSHGLQRLDGVPHTLFQAIARGSTIDLRAPPFVTDARHWTDPNDYTACQALARSARSASVALIRYASVREPAHGGCAAVLDVRAFAGTGGVKQRQTWFLTIDAERASWVRSGARERYEFVFSRANR